MISARFDRAWRRLVSAFSDHQHTRRAPDNIAALGAARWELEQARNEARSAAAEFPAEHPRARIAPRKFDASETGLARSKMQRIGGAGEG